MKKKKILLYVVVTLLIGGAYFFPRNGSFFGQTYNPAGTTFSSAKVAQINFSPATATSTSLLNTDSTDRVIESTYLDCNTIGTSKTYLTGAGLASLTLLAATTSTNALGLQGNTNYTFSGTIATSSTDIFIASSTEPTPTYTGRLWPTGKYLTFNTNATNTAVCTVGVHYVGF